MKEIGSEKVPFGQKIACAMGATAHNVAALGHFNGRYCVMAVGCILDCEEPTRRATCVR